MSPVVRNTYRQIKHILAHTNDGERLPANELALLDCAYHGLLNAEGLNELDSLYKKILGDK